MKHMHAELMLQYAQDAMETDTPWELWEYLSQVSNEWTSFTEGNPSWIPQYKYRRKKETIVINGYEVPKPISSELEQDAIYYIADITMSDFMVETKWYGDIQDARFLERGLIHLDKESAIMHTKALLSFTTKDTDD